MGADARWLDVIQRKGLLDADPAAPPREPLKPASESSFRVIPIPPSVNHLFATVRGRRVKSAAYKAWMEQATFALHGCEWQGEYPVTVTMTIQEKVFAQRDCDNFCKPVCDSLVKAGVIKNDSVKYVTEVTVRYRPGTGDGVRIELQ